MVPEPEQSETDARRRRVRYLFGALGLLVVLGLNGGYQASRAVHEGTRGKAALLRAEGELNERQVGPARQHLVAAQHAFRQVRSSLAAMGPLLPLARITPFVRIQARGVQAFADAGVALSDAGIGLTDSASALVQPTDAQVPVSGAVESLRKISASLDAAVKALNLATTRVASLDGYRLVGPVRGARDDLASRLPAINTRASSAQRGLDALLAFAGGSGPRRYLFFSQNPDEVRPTGGFIGTYGVLVASGEGLHLERFEAIDTWLAAHPQAAVPPDEAPAALRFSSPPSRQTLANVNTSPDWRQASQLAADLWQKGGEEPVDGVLSVTPGFLARVLSVLGAVEVPSYGEVVNAGNVVERFDFYTRQVEAKTTTNVVRKDFVAELAQTVMQRLLAAPASQWDALAQAIGAAFDARDAMVWSRQPQVAAAVAERRWDGTLPSGPGDFFYEGEFHYESKNGRTLRRTYDHQIDLRPDGSARVTTTITIDNPVPASPLNSTSVIYLTVYGPQGAVLDGSSDPRSLPETALSGHSAAAWFRGAGPESRAVLKVVWDVPALVEQSPDGTRLLRLYWAALPDHTGDVLNLRVNLPEGWRWLGPPPPPTFAVDTDVARSWAIGA